MQQKICYSKIPAALVACYQVRMKLNLRIRELRKAKGLKLADLAGMIGVSVPHLSQVERGEKNLNNHLMVRIAKALNTEPSALLGKDAEGVKEDEFRLNRAMLDLSENDKLRVVEFAEALRKTKRDS